MDFSAESIFVWFWSFMKDWITDTFYEKFISVWVVLAKILVFFFHVFLVRMENNEFQICESNFL